MVMHLRPRCIGRGTVGLDHGALLHHGDRRHLGRHRIPGPAAQRHQGNQQGEEEMAHGAIITAIEKP